MKIEKLGINEDLTITLTKPIEIPDDVAKTLLPQDTAMYCLLKEVETLRDELKDIRRELHCVSARTSGMGICK